MVSFSALFLDERLPVLEVMIRPRTGDFHYTREELTVILEDIRIFKHFGGIRGFVLGVLTTEGRVDVECMKMCVSIVSIKFIVFKLTVLQAGR